MIAKAWFGKIIDCSLLYFSRKHLMKYLTISGMRGLKAQDECYQSLRKTHVRIQQQCLKYFSLIWESFTVHFHLSSHALQWKNGARSSESGKVTQDFIILSWVILTSLHGLTLTASSDNKTMQKPTKTFMFMNLFLTC